MGPFWSSPAGQELCVAIFVIALAAYIALIVFETKWGDDD